MIFELGAFPLMEECPFCGRKHHNVQVGEENLVCACGSLFSTTRQEGNMIAVEWFKLTADVQKRIEGAYEDDPRNLN